jgi:YidC/Oxa1 family membrane protein insertase
MYSQDNKNLLLAIFLSVLVMVGWNYIYGVPQLEQQRQAAVPNPNAGQTLPNQVLPNQVPAPNAGVLSANPNAAPSVAPQATLAPASPLNRAAALALSPRVTIETPRLSGSISLVGGRIDDLLLTNYRETIDKSSANIVLFSPLNGPNAHFADFGWLPAAGSNIALPGIDTRWSASANVLKPGSPVTLRYENAQGLVFARSFAIDDQYMFTITESVENKGADPVAVSPYSRVSRHGTPSTQGVYVLHEGMVGFVEDKLQEVTFSDILKNRSKAFKNSTGGWLGMTEKYWASAIIPAQDKPFSAAFGAQNTNPMQPIYEAAAIGEVLTLAPGGAIQSTSRLFAGAKETNLIDAYGANLGIKQFDLMIDWGWFYFITKPLFSLMHFINGIIGNFGFTILIVTVLIKLAFFPLANKSYESMAKMKSAQPEMLAIRDRYSDDKMKQQQAMMELYKNEKINPLAGCLPVLIQIPVFFALYKVLFVTIEMRHAPFFGWIKDLAAADPTNLFNLFGLLPFTPPSLFHLGIWPIIMGITMWVQMKMNPEPTDPVQKAVFGWMPIVFTFMLGSFPAGLVIYWAWNNTLSVLQQYFIMRKMGTKIELWDNIRAMIKR